MQILTAYETKPLYGCILLQIQSTQVQLSPNSRTAAVFVSFDNHKRITTRTKR